MQCRIAIRNFCYAKILVGTRCRKFSRNLSRTALQFYFRNFGVLLFPIVNLGLEVFQMLPPLVDRIEYSCSFFAPRERRQWRDARFLAREHLKFLLLPRRFLFGPLHHLIACNGLNPSNTGSNRRLTDDFEPADLPR